MYLKSPVVGSDWATIVPSAVRISPRARLYSFSAPRTLRVSWASRLASTTCR